MADEVEEEIDPRELEIMRNLAGTCRCGWQLPLSVIAYPKHAPGQEPPEIAGSMVVLACPMCGHGHGFLTSLDETPA